MIHSFKTYIEVEVEVQITYASPGCKPTRTDPGCGPEVEFECKVINDKGELELLQDCLVNQNCDDIYDEALQELDQKQKDDYDCAMDQKYHQMKDDGEI